MKMQLTPEQQAVLDGSRGETVAKVMKTLVLYGETFGAEKLVPVTGEKGHIVTSFGLGVMKPVYKLVDELIAGGALSGQKFTADPRPLDKSVPSNLLQDLVFKYMYSKQRSYEKQLSVLGLEDGDAFTCTCYLDEVGNSPAYGDVLSWAESSAVVYANSVIGARCNRNSGIIELFGSIAGWVPYFGLLTDEGRMASWRVEIATSELPEAQLLGSAIGMKVMEDVPYVVGLEKYFPDGLDDRAKTYLKDFGAATASNGAVGLYHIHKLTPEAREKGLFLVRPEAKTYVIDDEELRRVRESYPCIWKDPDASPKLCFMGCPHMTMAQLTDWTEKVTEALAKNGKTRVVIPTVFTAAPAVLREFKKTEYAPKLDAAGVVVSSICPLMYMNNPLCGKMPVITGSNKLRTYTSARYYTDAEILSAITGGKEC